MKHARGVLVVLLLIGLFAIPPTSASPESDGQQPGPASGSSLTTTYCTELLNNGGFDTGNFASWTVGGAPQVVLFPYAGCCSAVLGYRNNAHDQLSQSVVCPFDAYGVILSGWNQMATEEGSGADYDWLFVSARSYSGGFGEGWTWTNRSPQHTWVHELRPMYGGGGDPVVEAGEVMIVTVRAETDASLPTSFFVDSLSLQVCCYPDVYEPYNDYANAVLLTLGATYEVRICPNGDEDWFRFPVVQGQIITADLYNLPADFDMNLYSSPSRQLCANVSGTSPEHCQVIADSTGEWRVRVVGVRGATGNSPALLRVQVTDPPTPTPTGQVRPTRTPSATATRTPTATPTRTPTRQAAKRAFLPIIMKQRVAPGPTYTPTRTATPRVIFSDDFNDGDLAGWTPNGGTWYNPGEYMQAAHTKSGYNVRSETGDNSVYEGTVVLLSGNAAGLIFRASADGTANYCAVLDASANALKLCVNHSGAHLNYYPMTVQYGHPYRIKVVADGSKLDVYLDGVKRLSAEDTQYTTGRFGAYIRNGDAVWDNLEARALH